MDRAIIRISRILVAYIVSISLAGCATSKAIKQAEAYANREPKLWMIDEISFAAIHENESARLCVKLRHYHESSIAEVNIDLEKISEIADEKAGPVSSLYQGEGVELEKMYNEDQLNTASCNSELKENEELLPVIIKEMQDDDLKQILREISEETIESPSIFVIKTESRHYIVFASARQKHSDNSYSAFSCYAEEQAQPGRYMLVPLAFVGDVVMVGVGVGLATLRCMHTLIFIPICLPIALGMLLEESSRSDTLYQGMLENIFPLPAGTSNPVCE